MVVKACRENPGLASLTIFLSLGTRVIIQEMQCT